MDPIKEAFQRAKQDISILQEEFLNLSSDIQEIKRTLAFLAKQTDKPTDKPALQQINPTDAGTSSNTPTDNLPLYALKTSNSSFSTGNGGVPTNRQTNQQTNQQAQNHLNLPNSSDLGSAAHSVISSIATIKQEISRRFRKLTKQEMLVFSTIYQLESEGFVVDYSLISSKLSLSESSIRDYTQKLISKGVPILKSKENNKKVFLSLSPELKKIAPLSLILELRNPQENKLFS